MGYLEFLILALFTTFFELRNAADRPRLYLINLHLLLESNY